MDCPKDSIYILLKENVRCNGILEGRKASTKRNKNLTKSKNFNNKSRSNSRKFNI